jgi:hypothetical protein
MRLMPFITQTALNLMLFTTQTALNLMTPIV